MGTDHQAICETVYRYAFGVDSRDWILYRSIFADEVTIDFSSYNGRPSTTMRADDWVAGVAPLFMGLTASQHSMTNPIVSVAAGRLTATCIMYMRAEHLLEVEELEGPVARWFTIGGYYTDTLCPDPQDGSWRLTSVKLTVLWRRGDPSTMTKALALGTAGRAARTDDLP